MPIDSKKNNASALVRLDSDKKVRKVLAEGRTAKRVFWAAFGSQRKNNKQLLQ